MKQSYDPNRDNICDGHHTYIVVMGRPGSRVGMDMRCGRIGLVLVCRDCGHLP